AELGERLHPVEGVTASHCGVLGPVADAYRELHRLPASPPFGVRFYRADTLGSYVPGTDSAADAILGMASATIDFPALVETAYRDGARVFVELGPGNSCSRMIDAALGDRPHLARAVCVPRQDGVWLLLRLLGNLWAERVPLDLRPLYGEETYCFGHRTDRE